MKWSKSHLFTLRDAPADAEIPSHRLMARAGLVKKVAPGIFTYGTLALRAIRKFEAIIRDELDSRGCQEILMPMVQPAELWQETGRWTEMGDGLLKFKNRNEHPFCLGATHEEVVTDYVRKDVKSYRDLPVNLYQIQTKYRDEIRPRFGLMRGREFIMKDAYSFDVDTESALRSYEKMYDGYKAIFSRLGTKFRIVQADAGNIGGSRTHEFQLLAEAGEDHLMVCDSCDFAANVEVAPATLTSSSTKTASIVRSPNKADGAESKPAVEPTSSSLAQRSFEPRSFEGITSLEAFPTPGLKTIADLSRSLGVPEQRLVKSLFFSAADDAKGTSSRPVCLLLRGSDELNPVKAKNLLGLANPPRMLTDQEVKTITGAWPGSCGPVGLDLPVYVDSAVAEMTDFIVGANRDGEHLRHVCPGRDFKAVASADLRMAREGDSCPECESGHYRSFRGIEVGHVFYLGTKYSQAMQAHFLAADGQSLPIEMGCYGIGVSRTVQAVIEQNHDADGIVWPASIAPFRVHLSVLDPDNGEVMQAAEILYRELQARGHDVLMDDRNERPGVKFKDADLIGLPVRLNVGARGLTTGDVELVDRRTREMRKVQLEDAVDLTSEHLNALLRS